MHHEIIGDATLYLGDCYDIVPHLKSCDACIFDPPYELSSVSPGNSHYGMSLSKFDADEYKNIVCGFDLKIFELLERICQPFNMFCFCSNRQISKIMAYHELRNKITTLLIWHKINAAPFANGVWCGDIEYIIHARDKGAYFEGNAKEKRKVSSIATVCDLEHPTVKPLALVQKYVKICSGQGKTILDPFMGSGTTGIACIKMGRKFIGIEKDESYFALACKRMRDAYNQGFLVLDEPIKSKQISADL